MQLTLKKMQLTYIMQTDDDQLSRFGVVNIYESVELNKWFICSFYNHFVLLTFEPIGQLMELRSYFFICVYIIAYSRLYFYISL